MTEPLGRDQLGERLERALSTFSTTDAGAPVLIAGGGIGGLATALALARRGIESHVLERRSAFSEQGAGIQIGPNGTRILADLGVAETLRPHAGVPEALVVHDGASGAELTRLPLGKAIEAKFGAPYWVLHREDLHAALLTHARADPRVQITMGADAALAATRQAAAGVATRDGSCFTAHAVIGADGIRTSVGALVNEDLQLVRAGKSAYRSVAKATDVPRELADGRVHIWLRPDAHVVHYPARGGADVAMAVLANDDFAGEGWSHEADIRPVAARLRLAPRLRELLLAAPNWRKWALITRSGGSRLVKGRIALIGDAAHPILPFLAQGGVLALEDAAVLAHVLPDGDKDVADALLMFERLRKPRVQSVAEASRRNGRIYNLGGVAAAARNATMKLVPGPQLLSAYDWIYGWRSP